MPTCKVKAHTRNGKKVRAHERKTKRSGLNKAVRDLYPESVKRVGKSVRSTRGWEYRSLLKTADGQTGENRYSKSHMSNGYKKHKEQ